MTAFLTPPKYRRGFSYVVGYYNYFGYILTFAACASVMAFLTTGLINLCAPEFDVTIRWRLFVFYVIWATVAWLVNIFGVRIIGLVETVSCESLLSPGKYGFFWSLSLTCIFRLADRLYLRMLLHRHAGSG